MIRAIAEPSAAEVTKVFRAPGGYRAFQSQVAGARYCRRPVRLTGRVTERGPKGKKVVFDTDTLRGRVLLKACGTRRENLCPPCATIYRGDAYQLVAAGLRGGKEIADSVVDHPAVLVTVTAPSFGAVHRIGADGSCHPHGRRCPHGVALGCLKRHDEGDGELGAALCGDCYRYGDAVVFNARVTELWRRTAIYALRFLGAELGMSVRETTSQIRLSYVKVVEFQRRGSVHVHAVVRLDAVGDELAPPPPPCTPELLATALLRAATRVSAPAIAGDPNSGRIAWGRQTDVAVISNEAASRRNAAFYLGKYSTKGTDSAGLLDHRLTTAAIDRLGLPDHLEQLVNAAWTLGGEEVFQALRLRSRAHMLGFRGHVLTKSKRYSTTFGFLRAERRQWTLLNAGPSGEPSTTVASTEPAGTDSTPYADWSFVGVGYVSAADAWLAEQLAESAAEARRLAREALLESAGAGP